MFLLELLHGGLEDCHVLPNLSYYCRRLGGVALALRESSMDAKPWWCVRSMFVITFSLMLWALLLLRGRLFVIAAALSFLSRHLGQAVRVVGRFDLIDFAAFDLHLLQRADGAESYSEAQQSAAAERFNALSENGKKQLKRNIIAGLPGANDSWGLEDVRALLQSYKGFTRQHLRSHLIDFLSEVAPHAETLGLRLCCHPDDPPFSLLGLPRVMSSSADYSSVLNAVDLQANGATLCTGSLGVAEDFDGPAFVKTHGPRIHFAHLRNTKRIAGSDAARPDFFEAPHLEGDTDMVGTVRALIAEQNRRRTEGRADWQIPMRPDHGQELLSDLGGHSTPGYPLIGRMRGLAELRGVMASFGANASEL